MQLMTKISLSIFFIAILYFENIFPDKQDVIFNHYSKTFLNDTLPPPFATRSKRNYSKVIGWHNGKTPIAPAGFIVAKFADHLQN